MCTSTIQITMPDEIVDRVNDRAIPVPELAPLSLFQSRKLSGILANLFPTFVYVEHYGCFYKVKPN